MVLYKCDLQDPGAGFGLILYWLTQEGNSPQAWSTDICCVLLGLASRLRLEAKARAPTYTCVLGMLSNFCCFGRNLVLGANYDNFCSLWILTFFCFFRFLLSAVAANCIVAPFAPWGPLSDLEGLVGWDRGQPYVSCPKPPQQPLQSPVWPA